MTADREQAGRASAGDFGIAAYRALIEALLARGYAVRGYEDAEPEERHLILRHDVDMSLETAAEMAEAENGIGVAATYFVLVRGALYNPFSAAGMAAIARIRELGHGIGLHFDASLYGEDGDALEAAVARECGILDAMTGAPVTVVSHHRPANSLVGRPNRIGDRWNAYGDRFVADMGYCSDSRGAWHRGHPLDHPAVAEGRALQLLTHPIWWIGGGAPPARLQALLRRRFEELDRELARQCAVHVAGSAGKIDR